MSEQIRGNNSADKDERSLESVQLNLQPTGLDTLDSMFYGGIPMGSTVLIAGPSGAGKTMLCSHWLFAGYQHYQEPGLYISLTEPISKLIKHQEANAFYKKEYTENNQISFKDLRTILEHEKMEERELTKDDIWTIVDTIGKLVLESGAKRVVLDSITALCYRLETRDMIRHFIFTLGTTLAYLDATVMLTSEVAGEGYSIFGVEEFICDGIFKLNHAKDGLREFRIVKLRGHEYNSHPAKFQITSNGLKLYPVTKHNMDYKASTERIATGITGLDEMTSGGFIQGSSILLSGPSGAGKSIMTQHFLESCATDQKKTLLVSFEESRDEITRNAESFGWNRSQQEEEGIVKIISISPDDLYLEAHFHSMQLLIEKEGYKNVVIDSLSALGNVYDTTSLYHMCKRFISFCKRNGVTIIFTVASGKLVGTEKSDGDLDLSSLTDTIILLRYIEIDSELKHGILILKMRASEHDRRMREMKFTSNGLFIGGAFSGYEGVMSGNAKKVTGADIEKLYSLFLEILGPQGDELFEQVQSRGLTASNVYSLIDELQSEEILDNTQYSEFMERAKEILG